MSSIAQVLKLLGDKTRLRILILVSHTPLNVSELTKILGMAQSGISRHLSHLKKMNLLRESKKGIWTYYRLAEKEYLEKDLHLFWDFLIKQLSSMKDPNNDRVRLHELLNQRKFDFNVLNERLVEPGQSWFAWSCLLGILIRENGLLKSEKSPNNFKLEIADLGCGDGTLTVEMSKFASRVVGVDINPEVLVSARQRIERLGIKNIKLISENINKLSLPSKSLDVVFFSQSLHHLENPQGSIKEAARLLRHGGKLMIMELSKHTEKWVLEKLNHKWLGFEKKTIQNYVQSSGFHIVHSEKLPYLKEELFQIILCAGIKY